MFNFFKKKHTSNSNYNFLQSSLQLNSQANWGNRSYYSFAENGYIKNVIAFRSIHMIASAVASVPFTLIRIKKESQFIVNNHPILNLLLRPNASSSKSEFIEGIVAYKLISGNVYILMVKGLNSKIPKELYLLRPDRVTIIPSKNNTPHAYRYNINNEFYDFKVDKLSNFSDVLHLKSFHPLDDWYGLSTIEAALYSIDQHNQSGTWNQAMLQNGARPSGALIVSKSKDGSGGKLSNEQYERLKSQIEEFYIGAKNSGRPILLEGGLEWKEMSLSPKDMDFIESKHSSARDIALAFGVPPQLLGIPGDNTYSNLIEARISLWEQTILPILENIISHLNAWLIPRYGNDLKLTYNKDAIDILIEKRQRIWQYVQNATFMTIDEKRAAFGLPPLQPGQKT